MKIFASLVFLFLIISIKPSFSQNRESKLTHKTGKFTTTIKSGIKLYNTRHPIPDDPWFNGFYSGFSSTPSLTFAGILNYEFEHLSFGGGASLEDVSIDPVEGENSFSIFSDLKYKFRSIKFITPFLFNNIGYSFTKYSGNGLMISGGIGIKLRTSEDLSFILDGGFRSQRIFYKGLTNYKEPFRFSGTINSFTFNAGLQF